MFLTKLTAFIDKLVGAQLIDVSFDVVINVLVPFHKGLKCLVLFAVDLAANGFLIRAFATLHKSLQFLFLEFLLEFFRFSFHSFGSFDHMGLLLILHELLFLHRVAVKNLIAPCLVKLSECIMRWVICEWPHSKVNGLSPWAG